MDKKRNDNTDEDKVGEMIKVKVEKQQEEQTGICICSVSNHPHLVFTVL